MHPFADGNGRYGRLWHTLLLSKWCPVLKWLPIESIIQQRQQEYYAAIAASNASGSCEAFVAFMLEVIREDGRNEFFICQENPLIFLQLGNL